MYAPKLPEPAAVISSTNLTGQRKNMSAMNLAQLGWLVRTQREWDEFRLDNAILIPRCSEVPRLSWNY